MCGLSSLVKTVTNHKKTLLLQPSHMHTRKILSKKAADLSCQKRQLTSPAKKGSLPLLPKRHSSSPAKKGSLLQEEDEEEEEAEERSRRKKQKKNKINKMIIINNVDPPELLPRVNHLADPGIWKTTTTKNKGGNQIGPQERVWRLFIQYRETTNKVSYRI